jgi:hypothetical protein
VDVYRVWINVGEVVGKAGYWVAVSRAFPGEHEAQEWGLDLTCEYKVEVE